MEDLAQALRDTSTFPDPSTLINFLANHDFPRFRSVVASDSIAFNALVAQFMFPGFPVTYYGECSLVGQGVVCAILIVALRQLPMSKVRSKKSPQGSPIPTTDKPFGEQEWVGTPPKPTPTNACDT